MRYNDLDISNEKRLELYPDGKCPECGGRNWSGYWNPEHEESGVRCQNCGLGFATDHYSPSPLNKQS